VHLSVVLHTKPLHIKVAVLIVIAEVVGLHVEATTHSTWLFDEKTSLHCSKGAHSYPCFVWVASSTVLLTVPLVGALLTSSATPIRGAVTTTMESLQGLLFSADCEDLGLSHPSALQTQ